jgi:hypothetical protein
MDTEQQMLSLWNPSSLMSSRLEAGSAPLDSSPGAAGIPPESVWVGFNANEGADSTFTSLF